MLYFVVPGTHIYMGPILNIYIYTHIYISRERERDNLLTPISAGGLAPEGPCQALERAGATRTEPRQENIGMSKTRWERRRR